MSLHLLNIDYYALSVCRYKINGISIQAYLYLRYDAFRRVSVQLSGLIFILNAVGKYKLYYNKLCMRSNSHSIQNDQMVCIVEHSELLTLKSDQSVYKSI